MPVYMFLYMHLFIIVYACINTPIHAWYSVGGGVSLCPAKDSYWSDFSLSTLLGETSGCKAWVASIFPC